MRCFSIFNRQNIKDIENELDKNRREHEQFNQDINANKVTTLSQNYLGLVLPNSNPSIELYLS